MSLDSPKETGALGDAKLVSLPAVPEKLVGALADAKLVSLPAGPENAVGALGDAKLVSLPEVAGKLLKPEKPDPRGPKPVVEAPLVAKGEASEVDLVAGIPKGEGATEAFPNALAVKV